MDYVFPTSMELMATAQEKLPSLTQDDPIFTHFPIVDRNMINLKWEQRDNYIGLQQLRGVGGAPQRVKPVGAKEYLYEPGVYGEFMTIGEKEMLERRPLGQWSGYSDISDLVMERQDQLLNRRVDRIKWILWTLVTTGTFTVPMPVPAGAGSGHSDRYAYVSAIGQFGMQTATAAVSWGTFATATPLQDFRNIALLGRFRSVIFDQRATAYMNQKTFNKLVRNQNAADFGGKKADTTTSTITTINDVNKILVDAGVPTVVIYEGGYIDDNGTGQMFIPDDLVVVIGARTNGDPLGNYYMTRNMVNPGGAPGAYQFIDDRTQGPNKAIPPSIDVHDGHNGGPVIFYPSAIVLLNVA